MKDWLKARLRCPQCLGELELSDDQGQGETVHRGHFRCPTCGHDFPVVQDMIFFGVKKSAAPARNQEIEAEFRWNFETHALGDHLAYAPAGFRRAEDAIRRLAEFLSPNAAVLDVGAGCGYHCWQLARHGFRAVAAEMSPELLAYGDACFQPDVSFERIATDCSVLPFGDGSFDAVFCKETAHHVENLTGVFREFRRVLKPQGLLVLSEPCRPRRPGLGEQSDPAEEAGITHQDYGMRSYLDALERAGFEVVQVKSYRPPVSPGNHRLFHALDRVLIRLFRLDGWNGWQWLKKRRLHWLGGAMTLVARASAKPPGARAEDRAIEVLSTARLETRRKAIDKKRQEVPKFLEILEQVHGEQDPA